MDGLLLVKITMMTTSSLCIYTQRRLFIIPLLCLIPQCLDSENEEMNTVFLIYCNKIKYLLIAFCYLTL